MERGYFEGGERKLILVIASGLDMLKYFPVPSAMYGCINAYQQKADQPGRPCSEELFFPNREQGASLAALDFVIRKIK